MEDLSNYTGENQFKRAKRYPSIRLDGNTGTFYYTPADSQRGEDGKYPREELGGAEVSYDSKTGEQKIEKVKPLEVVFLKIRRRVGGYAPSIGNISSTEHNHRDDKVIMLGPERGERRAGVCSVMTKELLDDRFPIKTSQIVYAYVPDRNEIVALEIKGAALISKGTAKGTLKFYDYLSSFGDEHSYEYVTQLVPIVEENPDMRKRYFTIKFVRGEKLKADEMKSVAKMIVDIHEDIQRKDAVTKSKIEEMLSAQSAQAAPLIPTQASMQSSPTETGGFSIPDENSVDYPTEDINPEDIPF